MLCILPQYHVTVNFKRDRADGVELDIAENDWKPHAVVMQPNREQTLSDGQRKSPAFFQEFERQENNLDSIVAEFEQTQVKSVWCID